MSPQQAINRLVALGLVLMVTTGVGCRAGNLEALRALQEPIVLEMWGVFDGSDAWQDIIAAYRESHPNVAINYRKLKFAEYEQALLEGWAEGRGPDIFMVHNTWLGKYQSKITPLPSEIKMPVALKLNKAGKVEKADFRLKRTPLPLEIEERFVSVVAQDVVRDNKIWGLPLSVDTLALYYNKDLFDQAKIFSPPRTWLEVKELVKRLTVIDEDGQIIQAAIALGGADNINRASDILSLLMMQNGTQMTKGGSVTFHHPSPFSSDYSYLPGAEALRFYTDFANPTKEVYTWNEEMPNAQDAFVQNSLAMMLGYAYQLPWLKTQAPKVRFGVAPVPHINQNGTDASGLEVNFANYWLYTVAKNSSHSETAWDFILFAVSPEQAQKYLKIARKPAALRSLLQQQTADPQLAVFANQALTAQSWYRGKNAGAQEEIFRQVIKQVVAGAITPEKAIQLAAQRVELTWR